MNTLLNEVNKLAKDTLNRGFKTYSIDQEAINALSTITLKKPEEMPSEFNKLGATITLAMYLKACQLKIDNKKLVKDETETKISDPISIDKTKLETLNTRLDYILNGGVMESEMNRTIESAFKEAMPKKFDKNTLLIARGLILPKSVTSSYSICLSELDQKATCEITETLTSVKKSAVSWGSKFTTDTSEHASTTVGYARTSKAKQVKALKNQPVNLNAHTFKAEYKSSTVNTKVVRHGAPCTHLSKNEVKTHILINELERDLSITKQPSQSAYQRYKAVETAVETANEETERKFETLKARLTSAQAQMADILQEAYKHADESQKKKTFTLVSTSLLSPGSEKEKSMLFDSEMAMESLNEEYYISTEGSLVKGNSSSEGETKIQIILFQKAINDKRFTEDSTEEEINLRACEKLQGLLKPIPETESKKKAEKALADIQELSKSTSRGYLNEEILTNINTICRLLNLPQTFFCKSGKDRTAQAVAKMASEKAAECFFPIIGDKNPLLLPNANYCSIPSKFDMGSSALYRAYQRGLSMYVTFTNTGASGYAFGYHQAGMMGQMGPSLGLLNTTGVT